jgi:glycosyltransferase involved in cell wall biosynthesis
MTIPWRAVNASSLLAGVQPPVSFVVERQDWSIRWDGIQICQHVNGRHPGAAAITTHPERLSGGVAHFGSQFMWEIWYRHLAPTNRVAVSYFHGKPEDGPEMARHVGTFLAAVDKIARVIVANTEVEKRLRSWGVARERLVRIPIGVDIKRFAIPAPAVRAAARARFGVPDGYFAVGSFQKDGVGWGDGNEPKYVKGPDLFVDAVARLARDFPIFVLLTGPARGYVIQGLEAHGIPYAHHFLADYFDIVGAYHALDLSLMTSREEGGPKAILESAATGVPVVSSRVGMAPDVIVDGKTGILVDVEDTQATVAQAGALLNDDARRRLMAEAAREAIREYDWSNVAESHWTQVYEPLMATL